MCSPVSLPVETAPVSLVVLHEDSFLHESRVLTAKADQIAVQLAEAERIRAERLAREQAEREAAARAEAERVAEAKKQAAAVAAAKPEPKPAPQAAPERPAENSAGVWDRLAACESNGEWDYGPHSNWGNHLFEGGLQFHPNTWDSYKPAGYPEAAYQASKSQQIAVAERVLASQGWRAWPACTKKLGIR